MKKLKIVLITAAAPIAAFVGSAQAALSTEAATAMTAIQTDGLSMVDLAWPVVGGLTAAFVMIKLFKRAASKV